MTTGAPSSPIILYSTPDGGGKFTSTRTPYTLLYSEDFESPTTPAEWAAYRGGVIQINTTTAQNYNNTAGSLKADYPIPAGDTYTVGSYQLAPYVAIGATNHVYVDFYAKMPNSKQGLKFCKIAGQVNGSATANITFGLDYTGIDRGGMVYVGFGDGTTVTNDTQNGVWLDGTNNNVLYGHGVGRSEGLSGYSVVTPKNTNWASSNWGTGWHRFQFYVKFNSGTTALNEVNDGEIKVIIDNVTYIDAKGLFNRHYSNLPMDVIHLFEWAQTGTSSFDVWMDSLRVSQNGWTR